MKYKVIAIEQTEFWDTKIQKEAGKLFQVCMFNTDEVTYCCEIIPSYYLIPLYTYCENKVKDITNRDILEYDSLESFYMHTSRVNKYRCNDIMEFNSNKEAEEYLKCNHPI